MRIVYMLTSLGIGGAERQAVALAEQMSARGHSVVLLVLRPRLPQEWLTELQVVSLNLHKSPASLLRGMFHAWRYLNRFRPELIHCHSFHANLLGRLLKLGFPRLPVISTVHNIYEGNSLRMLAYRLTDPLSARTTAVSGAAAARYVRLKAIPPSKCMVVTNGIDGIEFTPSPERRKQVRAELGLGQEFVWLSAGRIVPAKDYPNLLRAFAQVRQLRAETCLLIAGQGTGTACEEVKHLAGALGMARAVSFLGLRRDMPALLDACDGFVLASSWEGLPLVVAEAMAMRKPVVATNAGGAGQLIGDAGIVVPCKDPAALAAAMMTVIERPPAERNAMASQGRTRILAHFNIDAKAAQWENIYHETLTRGDRRR